MNNIIQPYSQNNLNHNNSIIFNNITDYITNILKPTKHILIIDFQLSENIPRQVSTSVITRDCQLSKDDKLAGDFSATETM